MEFTVEQIERSSHIIRINLSKTIEPVAVQTASDIHFDSTKCRRDLLKKHLDITKKKNGLIILPGDVFDLMQGMYDPRRSYSDLRPEYLNTNYIDAVVNDAASFFGPYAHNIALITYGNHENSILKRLSTDVIIRLVDKLNEKHGTQIKVGGYFGFIRLVFSCGGLTDKSSGYTYYGSKVIAYHHGHGGNAKRSKGVLDHQIDGFQYPDADIIIKGHNHHKIFDPANTRWRLSTKGTVTQESQAVIRCGTYKESDHSNGWETEKGFLPSGLGSWWINFKATHRYEDGQRFREVTFTVDEAK